MIMLNKEVIKHWDIDIVSEHIINDVEYITNYFSHKKNLSYVDIGANVGKFYDTLSNSFQIDKVYMVEPSPQLFEYISEKFKYIPNCKLFNFALSNENGYTYFQTHCIDNCDMLNINLGLSKITNDENAHLLKMVSGFSFLTEYIDNLEEIDFIKIDTETHDYMILQSILPIIEKLNKKPLILFENNYTYYNIISPQEAEKILNDFAIRCNYKTMDFNSLSNDCFLEPL